MTCRHLIPGGIVSMRRCARRGSVSVLAALAMVMLVIGNARASQAPAGEARFERVLLLTAGERVSVVFELTGEPRDVSTRRVSAAVLELDAGPVTLSHERESFSAPAGVRFVSSVSVQRATGAAGGLLKARIELLERSRSTVRVVGRRVYVDFAAELPPQRVPSERATPPATPAAPAPVAPAAPAPPAAVPEPVATPPAETFRATIAPAIERFDQLTPFLISATTSPSEPVLKAIGETLASIGQSVEGAEVPAEARHSHQLLSSAIALAVAAVDPRFGGDRAAQTRQALTLLNQAKAGL